MAKKNRYRALEKLMTEVLLGDALVFILFLIFSSKGLNVLRVITATLSILAVYHGGTAAQKKLLDGDRLRRDFPVSDRLPSAQVSLPAHCLTENFCPALLQSRVIFRPS